MTCEIHCVKCGRFLGTTDGVLDASLKCPTCKALEHYHIIPLSRMMSNNAMMALEHEAHLKDAR